MWVAAALSAQPEVDDFDGLFAVIVRRGREREGERVFPLAPHEEVGTFSGNITFPSFFLTRSLSSFLTRVARFLLYLIRLPNLRVN